MRIHYAYRELQCKRLPRLARPFLFVPPMA